MLNIAVADILMGFPLPAHPSVSLELKGPAILLEKM